MCIVLLNTAHPKYALIAIDNRDEYVLRPTSRPYWWTHQPSGHKILSARDLHRRERGTWMGIRDDGRFAVLTNFRESAIDDPKPDQPDGAIQSRGTIVSAWLGAPDDESLDDFVQRMLQGKTIKGVGGFSLVCGDLRRKTRDAADPFLILSNRADSPDDVPRICAERGKTWGLSNTIYTDEPAWPKIKMGKASLEETIQRSIADDCGEEELLERLFAVLDRDTMPTKPGMTLVEFLDALRNSIFVPIFSDDKARDDLEDSVRDGKGKPPFEPIEDGAEPPPPPDSAKSFLRGPYGTQRQTVILVDWEGNVTYKERPIFDAHGNRLGKGEADVEWKHNIAEARL